MNWELIVGIVGLVLWGVLISGYIIRQRQVTIVMLLPIVMFLLFISSGWSQL